MRQSRQRATMGLLLLMCTLSGHCGQGAPSAAAPAGGRAHADLRRVVEIVKHVEGGRGRHGARTAAPLTTRARTSLAADLRNARTASRADDTVVIIPRDARKKEKFLKHITGPLYFSPKCRKDVYRLYHHTRDCTIPAYFKRCARLLTRLAGSPQCTEG
ncbi:ALK and LTK ligand 2-like [Betta splendens]|uniref:ALK and LTK ligand 2-like n=1 Tax=Betta splendens TaxID=158456 RepID=A0A6P7LSG1_BETSP|nr:ALK and LTK ligand 2-like [Betta splendens]XP_028996855.1 ALK and LTK ligand 2-like [Betta splendens]XP_055362491.1 ALK and LTK ligand 2-like [Betta splendens]